MTKRNVQSVVQNVRAFAIDQVVRLVRVTNSVVVEVVVVGVGKTVGGVGGVLVKVPSGTSQFVHNVNAGGVFAVVIVNGEEHRVPVRMAEVVGVDEVVMVFTEEVVVDGVVVPVVSVDEVSTRTDGAGSGTECLVKKSLSMT